MKIPIEKRRAGWTPDPERRIKLDSLEHAVQGVLHLVSVLDRHKRSLLNVLIWNISGVDGKFKCRYRSQGFLEDPDPDVQHEHVVPRKVLIDQLLREPHRYAEILKTITACLVTTEEHKRLAKVAPDLFGWERYRAAGITVFDLKDGAELPLP